MKILVATITHRADDARIFAREIPALIDAGHVVTAIAPWRASSVTPPSTLTAISVPRTRGRKRVWALTRGMFAIVRRAGAHSAILVHDPELAIVLALMPLRHKAIWDVHEDVPAAIRTKGYLPRPIRFVLSALLKRIELWIEKRMRLILAEERYAERFRQTHPIVLNLPRVPTSLPATTPESQIIYVGSITRARGLETMLEMARHLERHHITLVLIGEIPSSDDLALVENAPNVVWRGPLPNDVALAEVEKSLAGLSLLADLPNYRHSMPTKVVEYMSRGVPVISTPLALAQAALDEHGIIVSFDVERAVPVAVDAIVELARNNKRREALRVGAFNRAREKYNWLVHQDDFVSAVVGREG